ncbi:hypothetical protein SSCG_04652 [Streptomyces clavuligerus]|nr:hypothetical protein SSCG_04652 [Streptomyces clavuligerus]
MDRADQRLFARVQRLDLRLLGGHGPILLSSESKRFRSDTRTHVRRPYGDRVRFPAHAATGPSAP